VNLFLVGAIVLLPFSTQSVGDPGVGELALPTVIMALNIAAASILHSTIFAMAARRGLLAQPRPTEEVRGYIVLSLVPAAVFLASIPVAYAVSADAARAFWLVLVIVNPIVGRLVARRQPSPPE
jgi:hypothetical protein